MNPNVPSLAGQVLTLPQTTEQARRDGYRCLSPIDRAVAIEFATTGFTLARIARELGRDEADQRAYEVNVAHATRLLEQRQTDPGGYVLTNNEVVQQSFGRYSTALNTVAQLGGAATPDQQSEVTLALRDYITQSNAAQARLGITETKLPERFVQSVAQDFTTTFAQDPAVAVQRLSDVASTLAENPNELGQIAEVVGEVGVFAMEGVDPRSLAFLSEVRRNTVEQNRALLPSGTKAADIDTAVAKEAKPLLDSFAAQGSVENMTRYREGLRDLAMYHLTRGGVRSADEAARMAYNEMFLSRNGIATVNGASFRVPINQGSPQVVEQGLQAWVGSLTPEQFQTPAPIGDPEIDSRNAERWKRTVIENGVWVNNENDTGVMLTMGGYPVLNNEGLPVEIRFSQIPAMTSALGREREDRMRQRVQEANQLRDQIDQRFEGNIPQPRGNR